jgi:predicted phage-related endonuclease
MFDISEVDIHPVTPQCWEAERPLNLNASEIAATFGVHSHMTLAQLVAGKRGLKGLGPDPQSPLILRGNAFESVALQECLKRNPTWQAALNVNHYIHGKLRIACTPDALATDPARPGVGVIQIKTKGRAIFKRDWSDGPPAETCLQTAQEMLLVNATWGAVVVAVFGDFTWQTHVFMVERNPAQEADLLETASKFWSAFDAGDHPVVDFERDGKLIALMYPQEKPGLVADLSGDNAVRELLERHEALKSAKKDVEGQLTGCESEIKLKLGDAERALVPGWNVSWKLQHRKAYSVAASQSRPLRVTRIGV